MGVVVGVVVGAAAKCAWRVVSMNDIGGWGSCGCGEVAAVHVDAVG